MWCWRRIEKIGWTERVRHEEVLQRVNERGISYIQQKRRRAKWIDHLWRRNCFLKHVIEVKIE